MQRIRCFHADILHNLQQAEMIGHETGLRLAICEYGKNRDSGFIKAMHLSSVEKWPGFPEAVSAEKNLHRYFVSICF